MHKTYSKAILVSALCALSMQRALCSDAVTKNVTKNETTEVEQARAAALKKSISETEKKLEEAIRLHPKSINPYMSRGSYWMSSAPEKAIKDFSSVIAINPYNFRAYTNRASCYARMQKWQLAIDDYTKQIEFFPGSIAARNNRAYCYRRIGRMDLAKKDLQKITELQQARDMDALPPSKTPAEIVEEYSRRLKKEPNSRGLYLMRALYQKRLQKYAPAIQDYSKALSLDPNQAKWHISYNMDQIYYDRASCYERLHEYSKAIADYDQILKLDNDAEEAFLYRGDCYFKLGQYEKAARDYTDTIKQDIDHLPKPYLCRAKAYEKLGKTELAKADYAKAKQLAEGSVR